jgi:predicted transcriptional regulator YdeE
MKIDKKNYPTRYFIGIEHDHPLPMTHKEDSHVGPLFRRLEAWEEDINHLEIPKNYLGLACYPPKILDLDTFDYFALLQVRELEDVGKPLVQKKLPQGQYLEVSTNFKDLRTTIEEVYEYIKKEQMDIHEGFDAILFQDPEETIVFSVMIKG